MRQVATVTFVQIQQSPMKIGTGVDRIYDPSPLLRVPKIQLTGDGIYGISEAGESIIDVHHAHHPRSRFRGDNRLSFGFLPHYVAMRERFGSHLHDGIAGENIMLALDEGQTFSTGERVFLKSQASGALTALSSVIPAPPCREFSEFCAQFPLSPQELKATLQFLDHGRRGYYAELAEPHTVVFVEAGDTLWLG